MKINSFYLVLHAFDKIIFTMVRFYIFIALVFIFVSCAENKIDDIVKVNTSSGTENSLDIITWNLEWFPKNIKSIDYVADIIVDLSFDIFGLQEITSTEDFNSLIKRINELDDINNWVGFRSGNGDYQELAYIVNTTTIQIVDTPSSILNDDSHYFAYREPYLIKFLYNKHEIIMINTHFKCCGDGILKEEYNDEEFRRQKASESLKKYIDTNYSESNIIIIGDMNDNLSDDINNNIFLCFIEDEENYMFVDLDIAYGPSENFSWPGYNSNYSSSHLDHILITNELFDEYYNFGSITETLHFENYMAGGWNEYETYISDHRAVGLKLYINP